MKVVRRRVLRSRLVRARVLVPAAALAGLVAALARRQFSVAPPATRAPVTAVSRRQRSTQLARLAARRSTAYATHRARRAFASAARRDALDRAQELRTAEDVAATLGSMKGVLMKIGQLVSFVDDGMPAAVRDQLAALQQDAPPMSPELAAGVIERDFGSPPDVLFAEWDPTPIAAASIGQVHRAMTHDGRAVAVKVQYPGVDEAIRADLDNMEPVLQMSRLMFKNLDAEGIVAELRDRMLEELDYTREAANQQEFADWYRDHPFIHVPDVVAELSSARVITSELATGARFTEMEQWPQPEKDLAAETLCRFVFRSLYRFHAFNGDPHPGNYLFRPGGQVTFLDFGLVKRFAPEEVATLEALAKAIVLDRDHEEARRVMERVGIVAPNAPVATDKLIEFTAFYYDMVRDDKIATLTAEYASEATRRLLFGMTSGYADVFRHSSMPPTFVVLQRINIGLYAILGRLRATANWRRIGEEMWPMTDGPPSSRLGELEQEWWSRARRFATDRP